MTSTDPTTTICTGETLTDGYWLWSLIATSWLSGTGTIINGSLLFFFACRRMSKSSRILRNGYCSNNAFIVTLFVSQLLVTCIVVPYRISQMTGAAYRCEGIPSMNGFINALMVVPRVTNGVIAYDRYKSSTTTTFAKNARCRYHFLLLLLPWICACIDMLGVIFGDIVDNVVSLFIALCLMTNAVMCKMQLVNRRKTTAIQHQHLLTEHIEKINSGRKLRILCTYIITVQYVCTLYGVLTLTCEVYSAIAHAPWTFWVSHKRTCKEVYLVFVVVVANLNPLVHCYKENMVKRLLGGRRSVVSFLRRRKMGIWRKCSVGV